MAAGNLSNKEKKFFKDNPDAEILYAEILIEDEQEKKRMFEQITQEVNNSLLRLIYSKR